MVDPNVKRLEQNTALSFRDVKRDMYALYDHVKVLQNMIKHLQAEQQQLRAQLQKPVVQHAPQHSNIIGCISSRKAHDEQCFFAKKIHTENKVPFHSKNDAFAKGFKACACIA